MRLATNERERSRCLIKSSLASSNDKIKASFRLIRQVVTQYFEKSSFSRRSLTRVNSLQFPNAFHIPVGSCHSPSGLSHQRWRGVKKKRERKRFHSFLLLLLLLLLQESRIQEWRIVSKRQREDGSARNRHHDRAMIIRGGRNSSAWVGRRLDVKWSAYVRTEWWIGAGERGRLRKNG